MFKAADHQVAGHQARDGNLGPLIDDSGRFYKPLQSGERGSREVDFYTSFFSNTTIPDRIRRYFPAFYGTQLVEASDGSGLHPHLILQNLLSTRVCPSVMDVKVGSRTWYPQATDDYVQKCLKKDRETTSSTLGFRISGLQTYESENSGFWKPSKKQVLSFDIEDVRSSLKRFVSSNPLSNAGPDCALASVVYGGPDGILAQLMELKAWFELQTAFQFSSCSVLLIYEKETADAGVLRPEVKLIDFAHVMEGVGVIDHNFLGGLCSMIKFLLEIVTDPEEYMIERGVNGHEKKQVCLENGFTKETK